MTNLFLQVTPSAGVPSQLLLLSLAALHRRLVAVNATALLQKAVPTFEPPPFVRPFAPIAVNQIWVSFSLTIRMRFEILQLAS